jgi:hypothetical protein
MNNVYKKKNIIIFVNKVFHQNDVLSIIDGYCLF